MSKAELIRELATGRDLARALEVVKELEAKHRYRWVPVGGNESNYGVINIGSDPGLGLVERVTNALDAVIEREAERRRRAAKTKNGQPMSPREAAEAWLGVPGGRLANLTEKDRQALAENITVKLLPGRAKRTPTVEVRDKGIGLTGAEVPTTILSLNAGNKITKPYLAGAYGQGGSTALAFSPEGTLIVTRKQPDLLPAKVKDEVAVTLVRFNPLDPERNKTGCYEYIVDADGSVATLPAASLAAFEAGTSVVHFDMQIHRYASRMTQPTGSLWWLLQNSLFDPVLPFWADEARPAELKEKKSERRSIVGNYTRLTADSKDLVEHQDTIDVAVPHRSGDSLVKVHYWVLREREDSNSPPIAAYVDTFEPVAYTFFGQTHGTDDRRFAVERLQLPYLAKYLIVQVEMEHLNAHARREVFSTTRDRLKKTEFYFALREHVCQALAQDENLIRLNEQRKERILSRHTEKDRDVIRERFAQLMERYQVGVDARVRAQGDEQKGGRPQGGGSGSREPLVPLPTKLSPSFLRIANTQKPVPIRVDRHALIRLESDAPDGYLTSHIHARLTIASEPKGLVKLESRSDFKGGRARLTLSLAEAQPGTTGTLTVFLFTPAGDEVRDTVSFKVEAPPETKTAGESSKTAVKTPEPVPVFEDQWPDFSWDAGNVAEVREDATGTKIFVNMDNRYLTKITRSSKYMETGVKRMQNGFLLYSAFYAWLQYIHLQGKEIGLSGKALEDYRAQELDRLAQTVVHSISSEAKLAHEEAETTAAIA